MPKEMRRFSLFFSIFAIFTANVFAADVSISRTIPTKNTNENIERTETTTVKNRSARQVNRDVATPSRNISRNVSSGKSVNVVSRGAGNRNTSVRSGLEAAVNTVGRNPRTDAASINNTAAARRAGIILRASTAEVGGRATIGNTGVQTGSNIDEQIRGVQSRASIFGNQKKQKQITAESLAEAKDILEKTSDLNSTCQAQYNECMDQFCAVVDANQKRCSCSANLAKYAKAQKAVEDANVELNDVAQRIRYVGLSADEIRAIMSATEAELEMGKTKDNTQTRSMLDDIADMIKDPTSSTTLTASSSTDSLLDMDFDFSSDSSDMFSLDMFNSNSSDISSKRGKALYNEAKKRCKTVLNRCKDAGGTEDQISGNYDLAIDKDCVAYEQGLVKLNDTLKNNVRSANLMLQKARLAVLQSKNEYDIKGCVGALEKCMLDDMVCGDDYIKCLDPTKKYIDENGSVVLGKNIANITDFMTDYNNTKIDADFIKNSNGNVVCPEHDGACIVNYLMQKIGTGATTKDGGLCRAVLDKCQDYTYIQNGKTGTYNPYNDVVINYIQRAMVNIKAAQAKIISDYASTCMSEVQACYNQQNTQLTSWSSSASADNIYKVLTGACYNVALTCGYAVFAYDKDMGQQVEFAGGETERQRLLIDGISQMFYQSFLCPDNSHFTNVASGAMVNDHCMCDTGYYLENGKCVTACSDGKFISGGKECVSSCPLPVAYASLLNTNITPNPELCGSSSCGVDTCLADFIVSVKHGENADVSCQMNNGDYGTLLSGVLPITGSYENNACHGSIVCNNGYHYNVKFYNASGGSASYEASLLCDGNSTFSANSRNNAGNGWYPNLDIVMNETCIADTEQTFRDARKYIIRGKGFTSEEDIRQYCLTVTSARSYTAPPTSLRYENLF